MAIWNYCCPYDLSTWSCKLNWTTFAPEENIIFIILIRKPISSCPGMGNKVPKYTVHQMELVFTDCCNSCNWFSDWIFMCRLNFYPKHSPLDLDYLIPPYFAYLLHQGSTGMSFADMLVSETLDSKDLYLNQI